MGSIAPSELGAVMFNLGYLPYANQELTTNSATTVLAIGTAAGLLRAGGVMTIICYRGHPGGQEEATAVLDFIRHLEGQFEVEAPKSLPKGEQAFLISLRKLPDSGI